MRQILLAFIPIFVAVDVIGVLPVFLSLTEGLGKAEKRKVIAQSILTAGGLAVGFIFLGRAVLNFLNVTVGDFMVGGGAVLFWIAIIDLVSPGKKRRLPSSELGVVPLGTPLIAGPAVLTTSILTMDQYGLFPTLFAVIANVLLAGIAFVFSDILIRFLGTAGSRALSKITSLLLAAIAVMMIRKGIISMLASL
ncbi:MAG: MarC family protein [Candidatus Omnitrophota bacterium]